LNTAITSRVSALPAVVETLNSFATSLSYKANADPPTIFMLEREGTRKNRLIRQARIRRKDSSRQETTEER
jgi:hypothetical protein